MTILTILTVCMKWSKRSKRSEQIFISRNEIPEQWEKKRKEILNTNSYD